MKELSIVKQMVADGQISQEVAEKYFPELKECEDEIRKRLIEYFSGFYDRFATDRNHTNVRWEGLEVKKVLAWLEKQGEQTFKHFELKAGHWYICHRAFCCRADHLTVKEGERFMCEKDGIVKGFEIKEPEKYFKEVCAPAPMEDEQKPVLSEEDSPYYDDICEILINLLHSETADVNKDAIQKNLDWLISLEKRVHLQPKQEWSEEDSMFIKILRTMIEAYVKNDEERKKLVRWLDIHCNAYPIPNKLYPSWKPSDEQMKALANVLKLFRMLNASGETIDNLIELKEQLKKLREE